MDILNKFQDLILSTLKAGSFGLSFVELIIILGVFVIPLLFEVPLQKLLFLKLKKLFRKRAIR